MEKDGLVDLFFGKKPHFYDTLRYYAKVALVAEDKLVDVRS